MICPYRMALIVLYALSVSGCRSHDARQLNSATLVPDERLIGHFIDDYGIRYSISGSIWRQHPGTVYHIDYWDAAGQFIIARNDESNSGNPGLWTRIDWTILEDSGPYIWGFCLTVYDARSSTIAASAVPALRETPRSGCNGFPFSRMQREAAND